MTRDGAASFWRGKRVLLTGHTGFKGSWLAIWLHRLGASVVGVSLPPQTTPNLFTEANVASLCDSHFCDIRDRAGLAELIRVARPEIVLHLAAQPLVRAGYREPCETFASNVMGTVHVLDALRGLAGVRVAVMVTTDKVYRETTARASFREDDALGGHDPYSASKAACEIVVGSYRDAFLSAQGVAVASARAGNVIGGGDWSDDRLIPDAVRAWQAGEELVVRSPLATRPWQHVLEPLAGYLTLARELWHQPALAGGYNFGPATGDAVAVREVVELARRIYGGGAVRYGEGGDGPHESAWLSLNTDKARERLGVRPVWTLADAVARTMAWYRAHDAHSAYGEHADARQLCDADIADFERRLAGGGAVAETADAAV
ncbi:MAG: CDP-glucose 4,6-dehydratase [Pseudolabrys sp.]